MGYNTTMVTADRKKLKIRRTGTTHCGFAILILALLLIFASALIISLNKTGYDHYLSINPTPTPSPSFVRVVTPIPAPATPMYDTGDARETPIATPESYVKTAIFIDGKSYAVLASRQAAEELIENVISEFESMCATEKLSSVIENKLEFINADDSAECISYDEAFAILAGPETPLNITSTLIRNEIIIVEHGVSIIESDDYYVGTRIVSSYGRDGKNHRILEYTYKNGILEETVTLEEGGIYPAIMESIIVGIKPIPPEDTASDDFGVDDCPPTDKRFREPVQGDIIKNFGFFGGVLHNGIDYSVQPGASCSAANAGIVIAVIERGEYGLTVDISHEEGFITRYSGLTEVIVDVGDMVSISDTVGFAGADILHFEIILNGRPRNPRVYLFD